MKNICVISFLMYLLILGFGINVLKAQPIQELSTEPSECYDIKPTLDLQFINFELNPASNHEIPFEGTLRSYYNQNYYFGFKMPAGMDVEVHLNYPDGDETVAGVLAYHDDQGEYNLVRMTHLHESPGVFTINHFDFAPGEKVVLRLYFSKELSGQNIEVAVRKRPSQVHTKLISVDQSTYTPQQLVQDVLISGCLQAFNVTYTGDPISIGYFTGAIGSSGFDEGIILCSGNATLAEGPDVSTSAGATTSGGSDPDLQALNPGYSVNDAAVLEFDFIPASDTIKFEYIFGSEEFPEYANSSYNDVFGFFLSGPGINGPYSLNAINIALLPNGQPVTIDNVYNSGIYYTGSTSGSGGQGLAYNNDIEYDGATIPLVAEAEVQMCQTYHIKLAIGDAGDSSYDSGVFFHAGSFVSGEQLNSESFNSWDMTNYVYEGCQVYVYFEREDTLDVSQNMDVELTIDGNASMGTDYDNISDIFTIPAGLIGDTLTFDVYEDGMAEGMEYILLSYEGGCPCNPEETLDTIYILDEINPDIQMHQDGPICEPGEEATLSFDYNTSIDPDVLSWTWLYDNSHGETLTVTPSSETTYYLEVNYPCDSETHSVTVQVSNPQVDLGPDYDVCDYDLPITLDAGAGFTTYVWSTTETTQTINPSTTDTYVVTVTDDLSCTATDEVNVTIHDAPTPDLGEDLLVCEYDTPFILDAGQGAYFEWSDGTHTQTNNVSSSDTYSVTVTSEAGCTGTDEVDFVVNPDLAPDAGDDQLVCDHQTSMEGSTPPSGVTGTWQLLSGPGTMSFFNQNNPTTTVTVNIDGEYEVMWYLEYNDGSGCWASDTVTVEFYEMLDPTITSIPDMCVS
ncbi:MAG: choice-of-anchor L domain-containing protein, partial [Bacteroidales bacterium]